MEAVNTVKIFSRNDIMEILRFKAKGKGKNYDDRLMVGMVGYPNVGKSSIINVLC